MRTSSVIRVSVVGAAGYSGAEAVRLLARHPGATLAGLFGSPGGKGAAFADLHPGLGGLSGPDVVPYAEEALLAARPDAAILATPNKVSAELAPRLLAAGVRVVDVSGAFRLRDAALYPAWYGFPHPVPDLLAAPSVKRGELRRVLPGWCLPPHTVWALFPGRRLQPAKVRAFVDMLVGALPGAVPPAELAPGP